jgi:ankyrin repeat protein
MQPLSQAIRFSMFVLILLLSKRLEAEDKYPWTKSHSERLQIAIAQDDCSLAETEISKGANPSEWDPHYNGLSPFTDAVASRKLPWVKWLLEHGADVNRPDANITPLMTAAEVGDNETFEFLLQHGADFKARSAAKENAFIIAARNYQAGTLDYIKAHHPEIVADGNTLNEALLAAAGAGASQSVRALLMMGADVKSRDGSEATPLISASLGGYVVVAKILLAHGAEVNAKDNWDNTALHMAANCGNLKLIRALLDAGADSTMRERSFNETPAEEARRLGHNEAARLLELPKAKRSNSLPMGRSRKPNQAMQLTGSVRHGLSSTPGNLPAQAAPALRL